MAAGRIDVHFHMIPQFYADMVYAAGSSPAIGRYPDWSPERALEVMDRVGIATALLSLGATISGFASGWINEKVGHVWFFTIAFLASVPGLILVLFVPRDTVEAETPVAGTPVAIFEGRARSVAESAGTAFANAVMRGSLVAL